MVLMGPYSFDEEPQADVGDMPAEESQGLLREQERRARDDQTAFSLLATIDFNEDGDRG